MVSFSSMTGPSGSHPFSRGALLWVGSGIGAVSTFNVLFDIMTSFYNTRLILHTGAQGGVTITSGAVQSVISSGQATSFIIDAYPRVPGNSVNYTLYP